MLRSGLVSLLWIGTVETLPLALPAMAEEGPVVTLLYTSDELASLMPCG